MSREQVLKVPMKVTVMAGHVVLVEVADDPKLAGFVMDVLVNPPGYSIAQLSALGVAGIKHVIGWHRAQAELGPQQFRGVHEELIAVLEAASAQPAEPVPSVNSEWVCDDCKGPNSPPWFAPNALWNRVIGSGDGILCPRCFILRAKAAGVDVIWRVAPDEAEPVPVAQDARKLWTAVTDLRSQLIGDLSDLEMEALNAAIGAFAEKHGEAINP